MKKLFLITIATALMAGGAFAAKFSSRNETSKLFKSNVEALADGEYTVFGHCKEESTYCFAICPNCGAEYWASGHGGGSYNMSGNCQLCNHQF